MKIAVGSLKVRMVVAFLAFLCPAAARPAQATDQRDAELPQREFRVIVGMEISQSADAMPDQAKEQELAARQSRILARLMGYNFRDVTRLRHHPFMAMTVDAAALRALLADPEVSSVTEDRPIYPLRPELPIRRPGRAD